MGCVECYRSLLELGESILVLLTATLWRILTFMVYLSASIGPSVLISHVYDYCTGLEPVPDVVESAICMLFLSCWAEFSVGTEKRIFGTLLEKYKNKFPNTMSFGRFTVHFLLYMISFCQLYAQFEASHSIPEDSPKSSRNNPFSRDDKSLKEKFDFHSNSSPKSSTEEREAEALRNQELHTACFLLALSYLVFITSRNLHNDVLHLVRNLPYPSFSAFNNCMIRIGFAIFHLAVNGFYFLPCIAMAYSIRSYRYAGNLTYFQLTFAAGLAGMIAALFEMNRPWPQQRGRMPFLYFENNMLGKHVLAHVLVVFILISYYRPFNHRKVSEKLFDSSNNDVMCFCLSVAFTVLHVVKYGIHSMLTMMNDYDIARAEGDFPDPLEEIVNGNSSENIVVVDINGNSDVAVRGPVLCATCAANNREGGNNNGCDQLEERGESSQMEEEGSVTSALEKAKQTLASKVELLQALKRIEKAVMDHSYDLEGSSLLSDLGVIITANEEPETEVNNNSKDVVLNDEGRSYHQTSANDEDTIDS